MKTTGRKIFHLIKDHLISKTPKQFILNTDLMAPEFNPVFTPEEDITLGGSR